MFPINLPKLSPAWTTNIIVMSHFGMSMLWSWSRTFLLLWSFRNHACGKADAFSSWSSSLSLVPPKPSPPPSSSSSPPLLFHSHFPEAKSKLAPNELVVTYLEINGFLLTIGGSGNSSNGVTLLVDPILEGPLDFGIPNLYTASKRTLPSTGIIELLPPIDCILLTQGWDDHTHARTLSKLKQVCEEKEDDVWKNIPIVAPPSAQRTLSQCGFHRSNIQFVSSGDEVTLFPRSNVLQRQLMGDGDGGSSGRPRSTTNHQTSPNVLAGSSGIRIRTTRGALVGPPWQARENGYILRGETTTSEPLGENRKSPSIYIEPHVEFNTVELTQLAPVDVVITPITGQGLPFLELVHGVVFRQMGEPKKDKWIVKKK